MPEHELIKSLEREGFSLEYPEKYSNEEKIIEILKEEERRLYLAIPLLLERDFNYERIRNSLLKLKDGKDLLAEFNKIVLITEKIFIKTKRNATKLNEIINKTKIKGSFKESEFEYYLEQFKESKEAIERQKFESGNLEFRKKADSFKALEKIFSPAKIRILRKIYEFKAITPTEKAYYYRDIKPLIDSILNKNLQEYLEIVQGNRKRK